ncbi:Zinc finger PHD-finger [Penicillium soppii]|uniref:Zinc finger PHD-finger n=1 Tax=Penicillium soppii TaxID=69789 RepID=UPI0025477CEF|nr:Zinc finger PHD-finger [Penicillium soppii]KAJ5873907.1 Zinc finger PHD-finger [Penicillium soppii]
MVELSDRPGGSVISSYAVQDRTQVAEVDPSMVIEYVEDDLADFQPCTICGQADNEDVLLLCDGCDVPSHLYCLGLDEIPPGAWYCQQCESQRAVAPAPEVSARTTRAEQRSRRTRAQQRRLQTRNQTNSLHWARVWQTVWDNLNLDLDFPFDDDRSAERVIQQRRREEANQREFQAWQRRFEVAERQGGGSRFRDAAPLFDIEPARPSRPRVPRVPTPEPESLEEMRAWNAFERAREIENNPNAARKRKEPTMSPSPEPAEPERKLKRPRTRRPQELAALAQQNQTGESSRAGAASSSARPNGDNPTGPSFLSSLLKEVEDAPSRTNSYGPSASTSAAPTDHPSPGPSSPSISPTSSAYSSPLLSSATPPPFPRTCPISPLQLSSPAEPSSPPFSPELSFSASPPPKGAKEDNTPRSTGRPRSRIPQRALNIAHSRSPDSSPTRLGPSLALKADIQKMVGTALKPHYKKKTISKEQYTNINRSISRMLYERVGDRETLESDERTNLETEAKHEVQNTVDALKRRTKDKQKQRMVATDTDGDT